MKSIFIISLLTLLAFPAQAQLNKFNPNTMLVTPTGGTADTLANNLKVDGTTIIRGPNGLAGTQSLLSITATSYSVQASDYGKILYFCNTSGVAVSLPSATGAGYTSGFSFEAQNLCAGPVVITTTLGLINSKAKISLKKGTGCKVTSEGTNYQVSSCTAELPVLTYEPWVSGLNYISAQIPGATVSNTNTTPITSDVLYLTHSELPSVQTATALGVRPSSSNVSVGASFKPCVYAGPNAPVPWKLLGTKAAGQAIGDSATTAVTATLDSAVELPQDYYAGIIATATTTGFRPSIYSTTFSTYARGASTMNSALGNAGINGYSLARAYADGCPDPFPVGSATVISGSGTLPAIGFTAQ